MSAASPEIIRAIRTALLQMQKMQTNKKGAFSATAIYKELQNTNDMNKLKATSSGPLFTTREWINIIRHVCETDPCIASISTSSRYFIDLELYELEKEK